MDPKVGKNLIKRAFFRLFFFILSLFLDGEGGGGLPISWIETFDPNISIIMSLHYNDVNFPIDPLFYVLCPCVTFLSLSSLSQGCDRDFSPGRPGSGFTETARLCQLLRHAEVWDNSGSHTSYRTVRQKGCLGFKTAHSARKMQPKLKAVLSWRDVHIENMSCVLIVHVLFVCSWS